MNTTTSPQRFPRFLPRNQPPAPKGALSCCLPTPLYGLGWVRDGTAVERETPRGMSFFSLALVVMGGRWRKSGKLHFPEFTFYPKLLYGPGEDLYVYHILAFNNEPAHVIEQLAHDDELLKYAKDAMGILPEDEYTLRWYQMPIRNSDHNPRELFLKDEVDAAIAPTIYLPPTTTKLAQRFPRFLPRNEPPAAMGTLSCCLPTPLYGLGWVRDGTAVERETPKGMSFLSLALVVMAGRWRESGKLHFPEFVFYPKLFNGPRSGEDQCLLKFARDAMGILPEDEYTLRWYKLPIGDRSNPRVLFMHDA
ncbi:hypothetical protein FB451DRAFT_1202093 [Mycena latifolia]|nr:hypothetical protein FB451DRAFT_1202093 [Mycena latifolia]